MYCQHQHSHPVAKYDRIHLYRCLDCQLIYSNLLLSSLNVKRLYQDYYKNELAGRFKFGVEKIVKLFRFFRAYKIYRLYPAARSILDVGSGRGFQLYFLKKYYHYQKTIGTQLDPVAIKFSREKLKLDIYEEELPKLKLSKASFDIITMWHVLEHVSKPEVYLKKLYTLLRRNGKLVIEVPNFNSWSRRITGKYWLGLDLKYHIFFFTPQSLTQLLQKYHFRVKFLHTFSLEYSTFISVQSIVSTLTKTNHDFFYWLEDGRFKWQILIHIFLFGCLWPICFLINLSLYHTQIGEVILVLAEKDAN